MSLATELAASQCKPLKGNQHCLAPEAAARYLAALPGWALAEDGAAIVRTFRFPDYYKTLAFVNALAYIAHGQDHHPDLGVHYDRVLVRFSTHDVGGLSLNDVICAAKANQLA